MSKTVQFKTGAVIYFRGDPPDRIFILQTGGVHLIHQDIESGQDTRDTVSLNDFFGIPSAYGGFPRDEDAVVFQDATLLSLTVSEFEALAVTNIQIAIRLLKVYSYQLRRLNTYFSSVLKNEILSPEEGLFNVGKYYYTSGRFPQANYVFKRYLAYYPLGGEAVNAIKYLGKMEGLIKTAPDHPTDQESPLPEETPGGSPALSRFSRTFQPGAIIFSEYERGDTFYMIQSGSVELTKIVGNIEKKISLLHPSELFGEMALLEDSPRSAMAIAVDTVQVLEFNRQNFELLMQSNPQIALRLLKIFITRINDAKRRFMILRLDNLEAKIADVLLMLDENQQGEPQSDRREFSVTTEEIARWAGITAREVQNILIRFTNQGRMELYADKVIVHNLTELSRLVQASRRKQNAGEG